MVVGFSRDIVAGVMINLAANRASEWFIDLCCGLPSTELCKCHQKCYKFFYPAFSSSIKSFVAVFIIAPVVIVIKVAVTLTHFLSLATGLWAGVVSVLFSSAIGSNEMPNTDVLLLDCLTMPLSLRKNIGRHRCCSLNDLKESD